MNLFVVAKLVGLLLMTFGAAMAPALFWGLWYREAEGLRPVFAIAGSMAITLGVGAALYFLGRRKQQEIFRKEATAVVGLGWMMSALAGALPFAFAGLEEMPTFADCFFESMSGLTTTGASVLSDIEAVPRAILIWRSWTHWLGGLGIIMLFVAILPYLGAGGRALVKSEVTGPVKEGLTPRIKDTAKLLYKLYIGYTVAQTILLMIVGMSFFDALCHTFGTLATGGFSTKNTSVLFFDSAAVEAIIIVFMILVGSNFALMHKFLKGDFKSLWRDSEWRFYVSTIGVAVFIITIVLARSGLAAYAGQAGRGFRDALFVVVSILTTTGYGTADFEAWPVAAQAILAFLMFVGGCAGSTGGGMKVMRWIILFKIGCSAVEKIYRPRRIHKIKMGGSVLDDELQHSILTFSLLWFMVFIGGTILIATIENGNIDLLTAFSCVSSTLNNIGPGFGSMIGPTENFAFFSSLSKWLLSLLMVLGRIEIYSIMVLFIPWFWFKD